MNKKQLTSKLAKELDIPHYQAMRYCNTLLEIMASELEKKGSIALQGFGTFTPWLHTERPGRNPRSGEPFIIPQRIGIKFKTGKLLSQKLNKEEEM